MDNHQRILQPLEKEEKNNIIIHFFSYFTCGFVLYVRVKSPDIGLNKTPPSCTTDAVTVVPDGVTPPAFVIEILGLSPPLAIHSILYVYPVQSPVRVTFKYPKSDDDCKRLANSDADKPTGIDVYV